MDEYTMCLPSKLFKHQFGFGLDFGCSTIKVVHTTIEDDHLRIRFSIFSGPEYFEKAMQFVTHICDVGQLDTDRDIAMIGVGTGHHLDRIKKCLEIQANIVTEHGMEVAGFNFLAKHLALQDFVTGPSAAAAQAGKSQAKQLSNLWRAWSAGGQMELPRYMQEGAEEYVVPTTPPEQLPYPVLLAYSGSSPSYSKAAADDTFVVCDIGSLGGKTFLGLGRYITDQSKSFTALHDLACSGRAENVDQNMSSVLSGAGQAYACTTDSDFTIFDFGHAADKPKAELKDADMLAALMSNTSRCVAKEAFSWAREYRLKNVFFYGGFATYSQKLRDIISTEFFYRSYGHLTDFTCDHWFITCGAHLGALGTLFHNLQVAEHH